MIYEWRGPGSPAGIPATVAGDELTRIYTQRGRLTPSAIVEESASPGAPLHGAFEWDDSLAAIKHREQQARMIVRSVVLVSQPEKNESAPIVRAFVSLSAPEGGSARFYKPTLAALSDPNEAEQVKSRLRHELLGLRRRYMDLLEIEELHAAVNAAFELTTA